MSQGEEKSSSAETGKKTMAKRIAGSKRVRPAFFAMLVLITIFIGGYALYFLKHSDDLRDYYLRRLLVSADNAEQEIDRLRHNVGRNIEKPKKLEMIPAFKSSNTTGCSGLLVLLKKQLSTSPVDETNGDGVSTVAGWSGSDAVLCFLKAKEGPLADPDSSKWHVSTPAKLRTLLDSKLPIEDFDSVVLARENGEVLLLLQHQHMAVDIVRLDISEIQGFEEITKGKDKEPAEVMALEHTAIGEFSFAEKSYLTFIQPLRIPIELEWLDTNGSEPSSSGENTWFLVGLKEKGRFRAEAMAISPTAVLVLTSLVILALFALPYLKLQFIGSRDALHKHDVLILTITLIIAASSITLALLELEMRDELKTSIDSRLSIVADSISTKFKDETSKLSKQLKVLTKIKNDHALYDNSKPNADTQARLLSRTLHYMGRPYEELELEDYPLLEMVYWIDGDGEQSEKWGIKESTTTLIWIGDRDYYKNTRDYKFTNSKNIEKTEEGWSLESIRSKNTGEVSSVLAQRVKSADGEDVVAAVYTPLQSVIEPELPPGFKFAIIDNQGKVLFHQNPSNNLSENLFDWVDQKEVLRAAVWSRTIEKELDITYRARNYRMHLSPLLSTPWSLLVLYDVRDSRLVRVDILSVAFFLYLIYLLMFLAMYFYLWVRTGETRRNPFFIWLWPDRERVHVYLGFLAISAVSFIVWSILFWHGLKNGFSDQPGIVALSALLGLVTFGFAYRLLKLSIGRKYGFSKLLNRYILLRPFAWYLLALTLAYLAFPQQGLVVVASAIAVISILHIVTDRFSRSQKFPKALSTFWSQLYLISVTAIVGVIAVLPTFMFYGLAHDEIMDLSIKRDQLNWSATLAQRHDKYIDRYRSIVMSDSSEKLIKEQLQLASGGALKDAWDIHGLGKGWAAEEELAQDTCSDSSMLPTERRTLMFAADWIPGYSAQTYELRSLAKIDSESTWCWRQSQGKTDLEFVQQRYRRDLRFGKNSATYDDEKFVDLRLSSQRIFFAPPGLWSSTFLLALLVAAVLILVTRKLLRFVYLMDLKFPAFLDGDCWPKTSSRRHTLVLRGPGKHELEKLDRPDYHVVDTSHIETDDDIETLVNMANSTDGATMCLMQFHIGLWEPQTANRKLVLLEKLLASRSLLEVHSDINPMHFFLMRSRDYLRGLEETEPDLVRWSAVLAEFTRCRPTHGARKCQAALLVRLRSEQPRHGIEKTTQALRVLTRECWTNNELEDIAITIVRHRGFRALTQAEDFPQPIYNQVLDQAEPYYRLLWSISSKDERMVLNHVAIHGFVSWRNSDVVRRLVYRGLVEMAPHPRLMNQSFARFVLNAEIPEVIEQWAMEAGISGWSRLKGPVTIALVLVIAFLFSTQPQLLRQGMAFTAVLAAGAPALIKLFSMLVNSRIGGGSKT